MSGGLHVLLVAVALAGCSAVTTPPSKTAVEHLNPYGPQPVPFSSGVRVGDVLFLSGQIGTVPGDMTKVVPGGIGAETHQALSNIKDILEKSGSSIDRVVKCTVMLADMKEWPAMNAEYVKFFPHAKPARSSFGTTGLALGAQVEIECIAVSDGRSNPTR